MYFVTVVFCLLNFYRETFCYQNVWIYTFGVGVLCATGVCRFSPEQLGVMLTTNFKANMLLLRTENKPE